MDSFTVHFYKSKISLFTVSLHTNHKFSTKNLFILVIIYTYRINNLC